MPQRTLSYTIAAANTLELSSTPISPGTLEALTLTLIEDAVEPNVAYATIGLLVDGTTLQHKLVTLTQGWLDRSNDLIWSGLLHIPDHSHLFMRVISDTTRAFRLSAVVWDFIPPPLREPVRE